ncbi:MAG: 50S ribosomal protein L23 [Patescibacteria group bacterium]
MQNNEIIKPHISEKASNSRGNFTYVFKAEKSSNKISIKKAVENKYKVSVESVRILNTKPKARRRGNIVGQKQGFKKAIVTLKSGSEIKEL